MKSIDAKLKALKVLFLDADGVFFTGHETRFVIDGKAVVAKTRFYPDGQGLSFLRELGMHIVFISAEGEPLLSVVEKMNNFPSAISGKWPTVEVFGGKNAKGAKVEVLQSWLLDNKLLPSECAYMGDDMNDRDPMEVIKAGSGLIVCPANATRTVLDLADIVTKKRGGEGAIRELADMILDARGVDEKTLPPA